MCCGYSSAAAASDQGLLLDKQAEAGAVVKLVYTCAERRTTAYAIGGKIYQFGNNERRRVNGVAARLAPNFVDAGGRFYGCFERFDAAKHNPDGSPKLTTSGSQLASDDLTVLAGVGVAKVEILNGAGVHTYADLAAMAKAALAGLLAISESQAQELIMQAAALV
ncbi:MAG: hypothetical protein H6641_16250 [Caldilineaceae bacterium]|nr:hypothetical protein [Caldilineaceae bacterium]